MASKVIYVSVTSAILVSWRSNKCWKAFMGKKSEGQEGLVPWGEKKSLENCFDTNVWVLIKKT